MKITICGSIKFIGEMKEAKAILEGHGHGVLLPLSAERNESKDFWADLREKDISKFASVKGERMRIHFNKVKSSDAILVLNYDKDGKRHYIGPNTLLEIGIAFDLGKKIFLLNPIAESDPNFEELVAMQPVCLDGVLGKI